MKKLMLLLSTVLLLASSVSAHGWGRGHVEFRGGYCAPRYYAPQPVFIAPPASRYYYEDRHCERRHRCDEGYGRRYDRDDRGGYRDNYRGGHR